MFTKKLKEIIKKKRSKTQSYRRQQCNSKMSNLIVLRIKVNKWFNVFDNICTVFLDKQFAVSCPCSRQLLASDFTACSCEQFTDMLAEMLSSKDIEFGLAKFLLLHQHHCSGFTVCVAHYRRSMFSSGRCFAQTEISDGWILTSNTPWQKSRKTFSDWLAGSSTSADPFTLAST